MTSPELSSEAGYRFGLVFPCPGSRPEELLEPAGVVVSEEAKGEMYPGTNERAAYETAEIKECWNSENRNIDNVKCRFCWG